VKVDCGHVHERLVLHLSEQELSYRKQIVRELRTQYVEGILA